MQINTLDTKDTNKIADKYNLNRFAAKVLAAKQLSEDMIDDILNKAKLYPISQSPCIINTINRIKQARVSHEKIMICGDFDADGMCATAILVDAIRKYGCEVGFYIPNRISEGYGLQAQHINAGVKKDYCLFITVDNGVNAVAAMQEAKLLNVDLIISDHHNYVLNNIDCYEFVHPTLMEECYHSLSGAGVAFELARALLNEIVPLQIVLVCVATVGDVMQLNGQSRQYVRLGIAMLNNNQVPCMQLLKNNQVVWDEKTIAFQIVPKLNATGRLADLVNAYDTVRYLLLDDREMMEKQAIEISLINDRRKIIGLDMEKHAQSIINMNERFIIIYDETFHEGLLGILAGKICSLYQKPCMVLTLKDGIYIGSIRSLAPIDLSTFFDDCKDDLLSYGGHALAAGISFRDAKLATICTYVEEKAKVMNYDVELSYDCIPLLLEEMNIENIKGLDILKPFGNGFSEPLFYLNKCAIKSIKWLSNHQHLKIVINENCEVICFGCKINDEYLAGKSELSFIGTLQEQTFRGVSKVQILAKELF